MALVHRLNFSTFGRGIFQSLSGFLGIPFVGIQGIIKGVVNNDWSHPLGDRILTQLTNSPGLHYRELQRRLGAANGTLRHRLRKMEEMEMFSPKGQMADYVISRGPLFNLRF